MMHIARNHLISFVRDFDVMIKIKVSSVCNNTSMRYVFEFAVSLLELNMELNSQYTKINMYGIITMFDFNILIK